MPEWFSQLLFSFIGSGSAAAAVGWFLKAKIEARIQARHMELQADLQRQAEMNKAELARFAIEHQVKFSHLHTKRAEVVAEGYQLLRCVYDSAVDYTNPVGPIEGGARADLGVSFIKSIEKAENYCLPRLIYLPEESAISTERFLKNINQAVLEFRLKVDTGTDVFDAEAWKLIWEKIKPNGEKLLNSLAKNYRDILDPQ